MPLTSKGQEIMAAMKKEYGAEKGEKVFYASRNKGTIRGVDSFVVKSDMTDDDWTKLRSLLSKFFEEEEKEPEHREDAAPKGFSAAKSELSALGVELKWNDEWEEFTVKKKGASGTGYHTDDLQDAISTGKTMAKKDSARADGYKIIRRRGKFELRETDDGEYVVLHTGNQTGPGKPSKYKTLQEAVRDFVFLVSEYGDSDSSFTAPAARMDAAIQRMDESNRMSKLNRVMGALDKLLGRKKRADSISTKLDAACAKMDAAVRMDAKESYETITHGKIIVRKKGDEYRAHHAVWEHISARGSTKEEAERKVQQKVLARKNK